MRVWEHVRTCLIVGECVSGTILKSKYCDIELVLVIWEWLAFWSQTSFREDVIKKKLENLTIWRNWKETEKKLRWSNNLQKEERKDNNKTKRNNDEDIN